MTRSIAVLIVAVVIVISGCEPAENMRTDFLAPRYIQQAEARVRELPRDPDAAIHALDRALALMPDDLDLQLRAARVYTMARAWESAIVLFEAQEDLHTRDRVAYAHCLLQSGREKRGAQIALQVIDDANRRREQGIIGRFEWALYLNDAGYILADADTQIEHAHPAVTQAAEAYPLQAAFVDSRGWALYRMGELMDAAFYLERARRLSDRDDPEILYHLGVVYSRLDRYGDAYEVLKRAQELDPTWDPITEKLRRLGRILPPPALAALPS